jgi:uncharacterized protein (TIGR03083 family)
VSTSTRPDPRRSLQLLELEQQQLAARLLELPSNRFGEPSNLPDWQIFDLCVHITRVCDSIQKAVQRSVVGDQTPAFGAAARPREQELRAMSAAEWVRLQCSACGEISTTVASLSNDQMEALTFPHPQGQRSVRWFCTQLLTEITFHRWDLERSLGGRAGLDDDIAEYLLPFLLDSHEPIIGMIRSEKPASFTLSTSSRAWTLVTDASSTRVSEIAPGGLDAGEHEMPVIAASPGWLDLAIYGRVHADNPEFTVKGPSDTADRFASIFGPRS